MTTHKLVGIAHDKNHAGFFDGEKKKKKALNDMEVRAGDTATYGDNVSENLHMTSKNEVKNNKFNFLNKQHLCNILFFFFSFFVWITCKCFCFRHPCFLSYKYTCNACNNLSFEMMEVTSTV